MRKKTRSTGFGNDYEVGLAFAFLLGNANRFNASNVDKAVERARTLKIFYGPSTATDHSPNSKAIIGPNFRTGCPIPILVTICCLYYAADERVIEQGTSYFVFHTP